MSGMWGWLAADQTRSRRGAAGLVFAGRAQGGRHCDLALTLQEFPMTEFIVEGMSCGHCVNVVTEAIHSLDPAADVDVDLGTKLVRVHSDLDRFLLSSALRDA